MISHSDIEKIEIFSSFGAAIEISCWYYYLVESLKDYDVDPSSPNKVMAGKTVRQNVDFKQQFRCGGPTNQSLTR